MPPSRSWMMRVQGWAAWSGDGPVELSIASSEAGFSVMLEADLFHPLSTHTSHAVAIDIARPRSSEPQSITLTAGNEIFFSVRAPANAPPSRSVAASQVSTAEAAVTVIVPVYGDYAATKTCLDGLMKMLEAGPYRALIVDDASPDTRMRRYLARLRNPPRVDVLTNSANLGFVGSVNRALASAPSGDVLLLNADTIVPPGFLDRLAAAARAVGRHRNRHAVIEQRRDHAALPGPRRDEPARLAGRDQAPSTRSRRMVNRGKIVDLPNGVPDLPLHQAPVPRSRRRTVRRAFRRGYFEEVDFCLRARDAGFRSVCAPDVYVGHAGSRSFRHEKKILVARNLRILGNRFPTLSGARSAVSLRRRRPPGQVPGPPSRLALPARQDVHPARDRKRLCSREIADDRARDFAAQHARILVCEIRRSAAGHAAHFSDPDGGIPQSVAFDMSSPDERDRLLAFIKQYKPSRIEFIDPAGTPADLAAALCELGAPHDVMVADAGLFNPHSEPTPAGLAATMRRRELPFGHSDRRPGASDDAPIAQAWQRILDSADRIHVPCARSARFAARFLSDENAAKLERTRPRGKPTRVTPCKSADRLGIIPVRASGFAFTLIREIARFMKGAHPQLSIAVIGETLDDLALMRFGNVFVSGPVNSPELTQLMRQYRLSRIFTGFGQPLFGHPTLATAMHCGLPVAYFEWSLGDFKPKVGDLALDPSLCARDAAAVLGRWLADR